MKLSTRGRYGTRLMVELAKHYGKGPITVGTISKNQNIPIKYLEQIIIPLKRAKLIKSVRGPKGGHMLAESPENINVWQILSVAEGKLSLIDCVVDDKACESSAECPIRPIWGEAYASMRRIFEETSLKSVINRSKKLLKYSS